MENNATRPPILLPVLVPTEGGGGQTQALNLTWYRAGRYCAIENLRFSFLTETTYLVS